MTILSFTTTFSIFLIVGLNTLLLGTIRKSKQSQIFFLMSVFLILWIISLKIMHEPPSNGSTYFETVTMGRLGFIAPLIYLNLFNIFTLSLINVSQKIQRLLSTISLIISLIITPIIFSNFFIKEIIYIEGKPVKVLGDFPNIIIFAFITIVILSLVNLLISYTWAGTVAKQQLKYISIGFISISVATLITNLILPFYSNFNSTSTIFPLSVSILMIVVFISIVKFQLFNTRILLGKVFYYILASFPPYFMYFVLAYIYETAFGTSFNVIAYVMGVPVAIAFTALLNLFTRLTSEYTDTHIINPGYNPLVVLEQHRQRLSNTLDIEKIVQESLFIIARTIRPSSSGAILIARNKGERWMSINYKKAPYESPEEFKIFTEYFFNHPEKAISYHNLLSTGAEEDLALIQNKHLASQMEKKDIGVIVVLKEEATIRGLLLVGRKEADEPYSNQEIKFLVSIADSMGLALGRALLYQETQQFNEELQQRVNAATSTLQKQNDDLETALAQLEEVRRQEKDMLDVMGHELRTPVSIARNALLSMRRHLQENEVPNPEKLKRYTKMAVEGTRREIALVETLLSTTKLEGNRMEVNLVPMSLMRVIKYGLRSHMDLAEKNRTEIVYNKPEKDIIVLADKVRIQEIMDNFLNNAIKYTGQGKVEITVYEKDGLGWIDVKDTGIGISEENLAHLGKKFFRVQNLYNKSKNVVNPSGTGLGLFVSFLLIDIMKGQKKITSKEGEGSTFSFGLPIYNGPLELEEESAEEMEESEATGESGKQSASAEQDTESNQQEQDVKVEEHVEAHEPKVESKGQVGEQETHAEVESHTEEQESTEEAKGQTETGVMNAEIKDQSIGQPSNEGS